MNKYPYMSKIRRGIPKWRKDIENIPFMKDSGIRMNKFAEETFNKGLITEFCLPVAAKISTARSTVIVRMSSGTETFLFLPLFFKYGPYLPISFTIGLLFSGWIPISEGKEIICSAISAFILSSLIPGGKDFIFFPHFK